MRASESFELEDHLTLRTDMLGTFIIIRCFVCKSRFEDEVVLEDVGT